MAGETMRAVQYSGYGGGPESLKQVSIPVPIPKKGEMLVKVTAASVNPVDWKIQKGLMRMMWMPAKFPHTPGTDVAGEVVSVGAAVQDFAPGDKIVTWLDLKNGGSLAEYAIASPKTTTKKPSEVSAVDGSTLPVAGMTALQTLTNSGVNIDGSYSGNVLITAAAGGVGLYAIQLAKLSGAHVTVTVGERNKKLVEDLGADEVLDYKTEEGAKLLSPSGKKYDVVINGANLKYATIQPQLSAESTVQELNPTPGIMAGAAFKKIMMAKQRRLPFLMSANEKDLTFLIDLLAKGKLKSFIDSTYPLDKAQEAWTKSLDGHVTGKIVIQVADE